MIRSLAMIAVAGFIVCVISLAGAAALGGADLTKHGWQFPGRWTWEQGPDDRSINLSHIDWNSPETTKEIAWSGDDELVIALPADVTVTQGPQAKLVITGPKDAVDRVRVNDGRISFSGDDVRVAVRGLNLDVKGLEGFRRLKIQVTAPDLRSIHASVASKVNIVSLKRADLELQANAGSDLSGNIDVDRLDLTVHSGAKADLAGRADEVELNAHSAGDAKLEKLAVKTLRGEANSGADASIAAKDSVDMEVHSGADVTIHGRPEHVNTNTHSGGDVHYASPSEPEAPAATNAPSAPSASTNAPAPRAKRT